MFHFSKFNNFSHGDTWNRWKAFWTSTKGCKLILLCNKLVEGERELCNVTIQSVIDVLQSGSGIEFKFDFSTALNFIVVFGPYYHDSVD